MKFSLPAQALLCLVAFTSCSTSGSRDAANIKPIHAQFIAESMTDEINTYPRASAVMPAGRAIYNSFKSEFESLGINIIETRRIELIGRKHQENYVKIRTRKILNNQTLVQLLTPFYDVHQLFEIDNKKGTISPLTNPTLNFTNQ